MNNLTDKLRRVQSCGLLLLLSSTPELQRKQTALSVASEVYDNEVL